MAYIYQNIFFSTYLSTAFTYACILKYVSLLQVAVDQREINKFYHKGNNKDVLYDSE